MQQSLFQDELKSGKMTPVHKKGDRDVNENYTPVDENYRPVTVLPVVSEVTERLAYNQLYRYLSVHNLLTNSQYGFRKGKSTEDAILSFLEHQERR